MIAEFVGGYIANSLAVLTDAAHLLSDLASFAISIGALYMASRNPTKRLTYGYHRYEIIGAALSVILIWILTGVLAYEAVLRVLNPQEIDGKVMFIVASSGLVVNILMGYILVQSGHGHNHGELGGQCTDHGHSHGDHEDHGHDEDRLLPDDGHASDQSKATEMNQPFLDDIGHQSSLPTEENINVTAAFVHVVGDALQSVGVMIAAGIIWYEPSYSLADPICTFIFCVLVMFTTVRLSLQAMHVLLEGTPRGMSLDEVHEKLSQIEGVEGIQDLHVWSLTVGKPAMTAHIDIEDMEAYQRILESAKQAMAGMGIHHVTLQLQAHHVREMHV